MSIFGRKHYRTPAGEMSQLYSDMAKQPHLLIAGATGSGKSVVVNGIIYNLLFKAPNAAQLILIDPKRVELVQWRKMPHTIAYASEPADMLSALYKALEVTENRFADMQRRGLRAYDGGHVYVIIDELADLMTTQKKAVLPVLQRLCQIGRAARVHVIACTQCPLREIIPTAVKVNFDSRVALRTRSAQDSRNILGMTGCETLPRYGAGYYMTPEGVDCWNIPMIDSARLEDMANYWTDKKRCTC